MSAPPSVGGRRQYACTRACGPSNHKASKPRPAQMVEALNLPMTDARLILVCGLPGSGKTTLAQQLAPRLRAVRFCPDEWKHDLDIDYYDEPRRVRLEARLWRLAHELLE